MFMKPPPPGPGKSAGEAAAETPLDKYLALLRQDEQQLLDRLQDLESGLRDAGLDSPDAIHAAYAALDASERQALEDAQDARGRGTPAPSGPARPARRGLPRML